MGDGTAVKPPRESRAALRGWSFVTTNAGAMGSSERAALHDALALGPLVPLPEMVFAASSMVVAHPTSGVLIRFEVAPALKLWAMAHTQVRGMVWDHTNFDFTYCTNYHGSVTREGDVVRIERTNERLPLEKLLQRVDIEYYDHVLLFEDDVRDLGEIYLEAKTRVMDFGFLILCRYYCRVDGQSVTLMDTRYYHEFGQNFVWRDHETRKATVDELHKLIYPRISNTSDEVRQLDLSADTIYPVLTPSSTITEKIFLTCSEA